MAGDNATHRLRQPPASLFSGCPCRAGFARGFLWDEGFHQLLMSQWDPALTADVLLHWFNLMKPNGWIPREQFLGFETQRHIEDKWHTQHPTHANPPTLLLALESLLDNKAAVKSGLAMNTAKVLLPKVEQWINWFKLTQSGRRLHTYRWRGREKDGNGIFHTLSSGLDDYPRANSTDTSADAHVDIAAWIIMMHRVRSRLHAAIDGSTDTDAARVEALVTRHVDAVHWSNTSRAYLDRGLISRKKQPLSDEFVEHLGYISLFPIALELLTPEDPKVDRIIEIMENPKFLWTPHGLRSLAPHRADGRPDNTYGTGEDYWRGPIWFNINYLVVRALHRTYAPHNANAKRFYNKLRQALITTVHKSRRETGFLYEQVRAVPHTHPWNRGATTPLPAPFALGRPWPTPARVTLGHTPAYLLAVFRQDGCGYEAPSVCGVDGPRGQRHGREILTTTNGTPRCTSTACVVRRCIMADRVARGSRLSELP